MSYSCKLVLIVLCILVYIESLTVIPEKAAIVYENEKYVQFSKLYIKRYSRRSRYFINIEGKTKHTWDNNITVQLIFMEYLHNEYRRTFIELHYRLCDFFRHTKYIGKMLIAAGIDCPLEPSYYHLLNMSVPTENFPSIFPMEKGRIETSISITKTGELISVSHFDATFKK